MFSGAFVRFLVLILAFKKENTCTDSQLLFNEFSGGPQMGLCEQSIIQKWRA